MEQEKKCSRCGRILPLSEFYKKTRAKDGHQTYCKNVNTNNSNKNQQQKQYQTVCLQVLPLAS